MSVVRLEGTYKRSELEKYLREYGGRRCTNACPPLQPNHDPERFHWCLLAEDHEGPHLHICGVERMREALRACIAFIEASDDTTVRQIGEPDCVKEARAVLTLGEKERDALF